MTSPECPSAYLALGEFLGTYLCSVALIPETRSMRQEKVNCSEESCSKNFGAVNSEEEAPSQPLTPPESMHGVGP